jgi:hypothetical protein
MEVKLLMGLVKRGTQTLYMAFIDLSKAYDNLDRDRAMDILEGYGVGPNTRRLVKTFWDNHTIIPKQGGYYGRIFKGERGVPQGDIDSPTFFNIIVDAVVRHHRYELRKSFIQGILDGTKFYADDGVLHSADPVILQKSLDIITDCFRRVGLRMNPTKTEIMIVKGGKAATKRTEEVYEHMVTGNGLSAKEKAKQKIVCKLCGTEVQRASMKTHHATKKCKQLQKTYVREEEEIEETTTNQCQPCEPEASRRYEISMPMRKKCPCPVEGCPFKEDNRCRM